MKQPASGGQRVAFFGGSFDPPHLGHLAVARAARAALRLNAVLFAPVGSQPLKPEGSTAGFEDRMEMTRLAIAGEQGFELSLADAPRANGAPNFTVDTLERLGAGFGPKSTLYCLMGADSFAQLRLWHRAADVPFTAHLIVASRPGLPLDDLRAMLPEGLGLQPNNEADPPEGDERSRIDLRSYSITDADGRRAPFYVLTGLEVEISASQIREWVRAHAGLIGDRREKRGEALVPEAVAEYIRSRGLYR